MTTDQENPEVTPGFIQIERALTDELKEGRLSFDEYGLFVFLASGVNYHNRLTLISYGEISNAINERRWSKNKVNKVMLRLKEAKLIEYPDHQGKSRLIKIKLTGKNIQFGKTTSAKKVSEALQEITIIPHSPAEVSPPWQKYQEQRNSLVKTVSSPDHLSSSRSTNNDTNTETNKVKKFDFKKPVSSEVFPEEKKTPVKSFVPNTNEEFRCQEIAIGLGETDMTFLLHCLKKSSLSEIETVYGLCREATGVQSMVRYFNKIWSERYTKRADSDTIQDRTPL